MVDVVIKVLNTSDIKCIAICMTVIGSHINVHLFIVSNGTTVKKISTVALTITLAPFTHGIDMCRR